MGSRGLTLPTPLGAVRGGKLPAGDTSEDLLTSLVFGLFPWLPPTLGISPFLRLADTPPAWIDEVSAVEVELWPWWDEAEQESGAEPDAVFRVALSDGSARLLVVECKRSAGLGQRQLARQAANARVRAAAEGVALDSLLFVTEDAARPTSTLEAAVAEFGAAEAQDIGVRWISWRDVPSLLDDAFSALPAGLTRQLVNDVRACLNRWDLRRYSGLTSPSSFTGWHFNRAYSWRDASPPPVSYRFRVSR